MIQVSEKALEQILSIMSREDKSKQYLRIACVGGGCSGLNYKLSFDELPKEKDHLLKFQNLNIVIDSKSALFIKGMSLDFTDGLDGQGFTFDNPMAKQKCGCGTSFSV